MPSQDTGAAGFVRERQSPEMGATRRSVKRWMKKHYKRGMSINDLINAAVYDGGICGAQGYLRDIALEVIIGF